MTTAVQPSELVFEFASNGMDEINQVSAPYLQFGACKACHSRADRICEQQRHRGRTGCDLPGRAEGGSGKRNTGSWEHRNGNIGKCAGRLG